MYMSIRIYTLNMYFLKDMSIIMYIRLFINFIIIIVIIFEWHILGARQRTRGVTKFRKRRRKVNCKRNTGTNF